jgi:hypothetical protein
MRLTVLALLVMLTFSGCKKLGTKDPIAFNITAVMPNTDTPIPGVKYRIVEYKYKKKFGKAIGEQVETGWTMEGFTGSDGKASGVFDGVFKSNYSYTIFFDYSNIILPAGIYDVSIIGPEYDILSRSSDTENSYRIKILPYTSMHFKIENLNCVNENDAMRYKVYNCDERPFDDFQYIPYSHYFNGCGFKGEITDDHVIGGHQVYQIEVTKNGVTTTYIDTFNLLPNVVNEVFIQY